jgi:hypothetical protein
MTRFALQAGKTLIPESPGEPLSAWISQHAEDILAMQAAFDQNHSAATHNSRLPG